MKEIEVTASNYADALADALQQLSLTEDQVEVQIVKESGFIRKKVTLRVTQKLSAADIAVNFINNLISKMGLDCVATIKEEDDAFYVSISGKDTSTVIGYRGDVLDCVQYLTLLVVNKSCDLKKRIIIDGENYREKRTIVLSKLAKKLAIQAAKTRKTVSLEPMNPFERRIIHSALADDRYVTTESEGEEPNRHIVIKPNRPSFDDRSRRKPYNNGSSYNYNKPAQQKPAEQPKNMYNTEYSRQFKRTGGGKMRSFGEKSRNF